MLVIRKPMSQTSFLKTAKFPSCPLPRPVSGSATQWLKTPRQPQDWAGAPTFLLSPCACTTSMASVCDFTREPCSSSSLLTISGATVSSASGAGQEAASGPEHECVCRGQVARRPGGRRGQHAHSHSSPRVERRQRAANILEMLMTRACM